MNNARAFGSIAMLGMLLLFAMLILKSEQSIIHTLKFGAIYLDQLLNSSETAEIKLQNSKVYCQGKDKKLCLINSLPASSVYDYNKIFLNFYPCRQSLSNNPDFVNQLSAQSFISSRTCIEAGDDFPLRENIYLSRPVSVDSQVISSAGFIYIDSELILTQNTEIIAGGDIFIKKVSAPDALTLSLLSASGSIQVLEKDDWINLTSLSDQYVLSSYIFGISR